MAVIIRDQELEQKLEDDRRRKFGERGGSLSRILRDIARDHYTRREVRGGRKPRTKAA